MNAKLRRMIPFIAGILVGLSLLALLVYASGFERLISVLKSLSPPGIGLAFIIYSMAWVFRSVRLKILNNHTGVSISIFRLFRFHISAFALNALLPAKLGDVAMIGYFRTQGVPLGSAAAILIHSRILDLGAIIILAVPTLVLTLGRTSPTWMITSIALASILPAVLLSVILLDRRHKLIGILFQDRPDRPGWLRFLLEKTQQAYQSFHDMVSARGSFLPAAGASFMIWVLEALTCWAILRSLHAQLGIAQVLLAICLANVGKLLPITPGGLGIYESILSSVLVIFGLPLETAVAAGILDQAVKKTFNLAIGIPATAGMGIKLDRLRQEYQTNFQARKKEKESGAKS